MASVLRIVGVGLGCVALVAAGWVVYFLRLSAGPDRPAWDHWPDRLANHGYGLLVPWIAAAAGGAFWSAGGLARPRPGRRWVGEPLRWLAAATVAVGALALAAGGYFHWHHWHQVRGFRHPLGGRVWYLFGHDYGPNTTAAWITLGVAGLMAAATHAAYPPPTRRSPAMPVVLRLLAVLLMAAGVIGYAANVALHSAVLTRDGPDRRRGVAEGYTAAVFDTLLPLVVVGLGGLLWVAVRVAYPPPGPRPGGPMMAGVLRTAAVTQMVLGVAGFLVAVGLIDQWPWAPPPAALTHDPLAWLALILVSAFLLNSGGVLWLAVRNAYHPKPAAPPASPAGRIDPSPGPI